MSEESVGMDWCWGGGGQGGMRGGGLSTAVPEDLPLPRRATCELQGCKRNSRTLCSVAVHDFYKVLEGGGGWALGVHG